MCWSSWQAATKARCLHSRRGSVSPSKGFATFRHPDTEANRDGLVIGYAAPTPSAWSAALEALTRLLP